MLVNVVYPPSRPTEWPAGFQDDALVHLSQFHSGRTSARLKNLATHSIRANALSFLQCRNHTFSSRAISCTSTGSVAASLREIARDPDATAEKDSCSSRTLLRSCTSLPKTPVKCSCHRSSRSASLVVKVPSFLQIGKATAFCFLPASAHARRCASLAFHSKNASLSVMRAGFAIRLSRSA